MRRSYKTLCLDCGEMVHGCCDNCGSCPLCGPCYCGEGTYRLVVGEKGNEKGHVVQTAAITIVAAYEALGAELKAYKGDGWGRVEYLREGGWERC